MIVAVVVTAATELFVHVERDDSERGQRRGGLAITPFGISLGDVGESAVLVVNELFEVRIAAKLGREVHGERKESCYVEERVVVTLGYLKLMRCEADGLFDVDAVDAAENCLTSLDVEEMEKVWTVHKRRHQGIRELILETEINSGFLVDALRRETEIRLQPHHLLSTGT